MQYIQKLIKDNKLSIKHLERSVFGGGYRIANLLRMHSVSVDTLKTLKEYFVKQGILNGDCDIGTFLDEVSQDFDFKGL